MPNLSDEILNDSVTRAVRLERFKNNQTKRIVKFLNDKVFKDVEEKLLIRLSKIEDRGFDLSPRTTARLQKIRKQTAKIIREGMSETYKGLKVDLRELAKIEADWQVDLIESKLPIDFDILTPSPDVLNNLVTNRRMRGKYIRQWFTELSNSTISKVDQQVMLGMAEGESVSKIVRRIRGTKRRGFTDGIKGITSRNATTLVRSSVTHISNAARSTVYNENASLLNGWQFVATLDRRTSDICISLDGTEHELNEGPLPPVHLNCRSTTIPIIKSWRQLGIKANEVEPGTRASMDGQVSEKLTYGEWLKTQSASIQNEVLGKTKGQMYRAGKFKVSQFVDETGHSLTIKELKDLK